MKSFKEFLTEDVNFVLSKYADQADFFVSERPNSLFVHKVVVKDKKQGVGTKIMQDLIKYADKEGKRIELDPSTDFGGSSKSRLVKFYKRFKFVENKGKNKDYEVSAAMYREPK